MKSFYRLKSALIILATLLQLEAGSSLGLDFEQSELDKVEQTHGAAARKRFVAWQRLFNQALGHSDMEKLRLVNDFFNQNTAFIEDKILWKKEDYWATPAEFLAKGAGDCEDYSIAKYFTLVEMGVDENKLRITYVKAIVLNQAHMVLTYYESPDQTPLILDNLTQGIDRATQRKDLVPVYSFNGSNLWLTRNKASNTPDSDSDQLSEWHDLKKRLLEIPQ